MRTRTTKAADATTLASRGAGLGEKHATPAVVVVLVGFMGAGKSTVGRALGDRLGWVFEDLDARIERNEARTVAEIFRDSGEPVFRDAERMALREALEERHAGGPRIVALGGGAFVQRRNLALLNAAGASTVFLDATAEELWQRCSQQAAAENALRPLLGDRQRFQDLYDSRRNSYLKAKFRIETTGRDVEAIADEIAATLRLEKNRCR